MRKLSPVDVNWHAQYLSVSFSVYDSVNLKNRPGEMELGEDIDRDTTMAVILTSSETDQFNEREKKVLETLQSDLCPVRMFSKWKTLFTGPTQHNSLVFCTHLSTRLAATLRMAGMECDVGGIRLGTNSVRGECASAMFAAGYEVDAIKRLGGGMGFK